MDIWHVVSKGPLLQAQPTPTLGIRENSGEGCVELADGDVSKQERSENLQDPPKKVYFLRLDCTSFELKVFK